MKDYDDKDLVIVCVMLITVAALAIPNIDPAAITLAGKAFYGLFGVAVGKAISK